MGGTLLKTKDYDYVTNDQSGNAANYDAPRRSVYLPIIRNAMFDMFQAYDVGDPSAVNAKRATNHGRAAGIVGHEQPVRAGTGETLGGGLAENRADGRRTNPDDVP